MSVASIFRTTGAYPIHQAICRYRKSSTADRFTAIDTIDGSLNRCCHFCSQQSIGWVIPTFEFEFWLTDLNSATRRASHSAEMQDHAAKNSDNGFAGGRKDDIDQTSGSNAEGCRLQR